MHHRDTLVQTLLSLFVPGYIVYWLYETMKDIEKTYGHKAPNIWLMIGPLVAILVLSFVWPILLIIGAGTAASTGSEAAGGGIALVSTLLFILAFPFAIALPLIYDWKFSRNIEKVFGHDPGHALTFIMLWFISPVAVYIVQEKINKLIMNAMYGQQPQYYQQPYPQQQQQPPTNQQQ